MCIRDRDIYANKDSFFGEIRKTEELVGNIIGPENVMKLFRFPGGSYGDLRAPFRDYINEIGYKYVDWNALNSDADGRKFSAERGMSEIKKYCTDTGDVIILMLSLIHIFQLLLGGKAQCENMVIVNHGVAQIVVFIAAVSYTHLEIDCHNINWLDIQFLQLFHMLGIASHCKDSGMDCRMQRFYTSIETFGKPGNIRYAGDWQAGVGNCLGGTAGRKNFISQID